MPNCSNAHHNESEGEIQCRLQRKTSALSKCIFRCPIKSCRNTISVMQGPLLSNLRVPAGLIVYAFFTGIIYYESTRRIKE